MRRAFTLIELLVVLGIIALLIGILLPTLSRARQQGRAVACKAQLQNIGVAFRMYLNDNRDRYPQAPTLPSVNPYKLPTIPQYLSRNVGGQLNVFRCPSDETVFPAEGISYFYYAEVGERPLDQTFFFKMGKSASRVPILWDADNFHGGTLPYNWLFADGHVEDFLAGLSAGTTP